MKYSFYPWDFFYNSASKSSKNASEISRNPKVFAFRGVLPVTTRKKTLDGRPSSQVSNVLPIGGIFAGDTGDEGESGHPAKSLLKTITDSAGYTAGGTARGGGAGGVAQR